MHRGPVSHERTYETLLSLLGCEHGFSIETSEVCGGVVFVQVLGDVLG